MESTLEDDKEECQIAEEDMHVSASKIMPETTSTSPKKSKDRNEESIDVLMKVATKVS